MKSAQISTEYLVITGFIFLVTAFLILFFLEESNNLDDDINMIHAEKVIKTIADSADRVYSLGQGSKTTVHASIPEKVIDSGVKEKYLYFNISTTKGSINADDSTHAKLNGSLPKKQGLYQISIESRKGFVQINSR